MSVNFDGLSDPRIIKALMGFKEFPDNKSEGARVAGMHRSSYSRALKFIEDNTEPERPEFPIFPDDDIDADQILDHMSKRFDRRLAREDALKWFGIKMKSDKPIGLAVVGDPHIGSNGCNIRLLRRDVSLMADTPGIHAINIGDTVDNWGGRLIFAYAENDVSRQTERRLARWFLQDSGIPWLLWLMGNHDLMDGEFATYLKTLNAETFPMVDWQAKFELQFPNGKVCRVDAAHNHKGTSIYNPLHGQKREALWHGGEHADIIVAGHHHNAAIEQGETADGRMVTLARTRGYKWIDQWATTRGFPENHYGATVLFVIDPTAEDAASYVHPFLDLKAGCEYLTYLRQ